MDPIAVVKIVPLLMVHTHQNIFMINVQEKGPSMAKCDQFYRRAVGHAVTG